MHKWEQNMREAQESYAKEKQKTEQLNNQVKDLSMKLKNLEKKSKEEKERITADRDDLNKQLVKIQSKET